MISFHFLNVPSAEAVPDKDREKAKHLFADFR
jgi:hypothetical protein